MTLGSLIRDVLKREVAVVTPMLTSGSFVYEEGEGLEEDEVSKAKTASEAAIRSMRSTL
jgi:hypothetical protein